MIKQSKWVSIICAMIIGALFFLAVTAVFLVSGVLSLNKNTLVFTTESAEALYDGIPLTNHNWRMSLGTLKKGHELQVVCDGSQTNVGESKNTITVKIYDELGADVTGDYNINYKLGTLKVNPRSLMITSSSASKMYDGEPLVSPEYAIAPDCDGLVNGHKLSVLVTGYIIEPGKVNNTIDTVNVYDESDRDVSTNYRIIMREGLLVIDQEVVGPGGSGEGSGEGSGGASGAEDMEFDGEGNLIPGPGQKNVVLFSVYSNVDDYIYLRIQSYGDYSGTGWKDAQAYETLIMDQYAASFLTSFSLAGDLGQSNELEILSHCGKYALPYYTSLDSEDFSLPTGDLKYEGNTSEPYSVNYYRYNAKSMISTGGAIKSYEKDYRDFVYNQYLIIDPESQAYMQQLIDELGFKKDDPDVVEKVASYIQGAAKYNLSYDPNLDAEPNVAVAFLENYKEGVCKHYASAATLMFRTLGIPARYTVGVASKVEANTLTAIMASQSHAWVEIYVDGLGWVLVEVTGADPDIGFGAGGPNGEGLAGEGEGGAGGAGNSPGGPSEDPMNGEVEFSGFSSLLSGPEHKDVVLYSVYSNVNDHIYLKMQSYGNYNGKGWEDAKMYDVLLHGDLVASYLTTYSLNGAPENICSLDIKAHCEWYALPYYPIPYSGNYTMPFSDAKCAGDTSEVYSVDYLKYDPENLVKPSGAVLDYEKEYRRFVYNQYLTIDDQSLAYMQKLIEEQGFSAKDPDVVKKVASYIQNAAAYNLKYDARLDKEENIAIAFLETYKEGVCRHYASAATLLYRALGIPARYTVGVASETTADAWTSITAEKAHAWVEVYLDGIGWVMVEVTGSDGNGGIGGAGGSGDMEGGDSAGDNGGSGGGGGERSKRVTLTPKHVRYQYDGKTYSMLDIQNPEIYGFSKYEELGYTYEAVVSGEASEPGKTATVIEKITIYDPEHNDVTDQFELDLKPGVLQIYLDHYVFQSVGMDIIYRGSAPDLYVNYDHSLDELYDVEFTSTAESRVGDHMNSFKTKLTDKEGNDVTDLYWVDNQFAPVKITPLEITVKAGDAEKIYDGEPLTSDEYAIVQGMLAYGHYITICQIEGSQTEIGRSDNIITQVVIFDADGKDVTSNYSIDLLAGKLKVKFR